MLLRCSVKYMRGCELFIGLILFFIISHVALLALIGVFATSRLPNPVLSTISFVIAMWSWPS
jgi:hypothetical protein